MRLAAALVLVLFASPAFAAGFGQGVADKPGRTQTEKQKADAQERKDQLEQTERDYKNTIKSMPDSKEKYDPWKSSR